MKPYVKIGSFLLAIMMIFSVLIVSGCTPVSLDKEWSYKTNEKELPIGVYIYSLDTAYQKAKSYAEKLDGYDSTKDSWLEMEITDDDGKKEVAGKWIKDQAKLMCLSYLVIEEQIEKEGADVTADSIASADEVAKTSWEVGPYANYGYVMPMKDDLTPYGISFESFRYCTYEYSVRNQALFDKLYNEGGSKAVSDDELTKYFNDNYTDYSYFTVNLYTSEADESGQSKNTAMSEKEAKKVTDEIDAYVKDVNSGKSFDDVLKAYQKANNIDSDPSVSNTENLENSSLGDEVKEALKKLDNSKAAAVKVGDGDSAVYYFVYKKDVKKAAKDYIADKKNHADVLSSMKSDEFTNYIKELTKKLDYEENTSVIRKYEPKMFFAPVEPTTAAEETTSAQ